MEGTQEGQTSYLSGDVPVECVPLMPVSLTATRGPGTVCTGAQREPARVEPPGPPQSQKEASPVCRPGIKYSSPVHCAHVKRRTRVQLPVLQPTNARLTPGRGTAFLKNSGDRCKRHAARNRYGVCYKCDDLHTNLSRHSSGCDQTPSDTTPLHSDGLGGEPSARKPDTP